VIGPDKRQRVEEAPSPYEVAGGALEVMDVERGAA
jgi:hypothetical protein